MGSWIVTVVVLLATFGSLLGAIVYLRLWKTLLESLREMWKDKGEASGMEMSGVTSGINETQSQRASRNSWIDNVQVQRNQSHTANPMVQNNEAESET